MTPQREGPTVTAQVLRRTPFSWLAWGPGGIRPLRHLQVAYQSKQPIVVPWWLRLAAWAATAAPVGVMTEARFAPIGPLAFEASLFAAGASWQWRRTRSLPSPPGSGGGGDGPDLDGMREPRRPEPVAGAGAAALPEPTQTEGAE